MVKTFKTHLDEIVDYPYKVLNELYKNQNFVSLLVNVPNADLNNEDVEKSYWDSTHDYDYVDGVIQTAQSFICVDTEISVVTNTIKDIYINILIGVSNSLMKLSKDYKLIGNRRDNLIREIDYSLRENNSFGIGGLELVGRIKPVTIAGKDFACKIVSYKVPSFAQANNIKR